eukprot:COSAG04_NODE_2655_length_3782_cov_7.891121_5_plen_111_part_01
MQKFCRSQDDNPGALCVGGQCRGRAGRVGATPAPMRLLPVSVVLGLSCASAQPIHHVCPAAVLGGCAEEWPRACWQGSAVTWRWSFAAASMAALLAQHRKLWRRRSSKGVS